MFPNENGGRERQALGKQRFLLAYSFTKGLPTKNPAAQWVGLSSCVFHTRIIDI